MALFRALVVLLLLAAGLSFGAYAFTGNDKHKRRGLLILKWTVLATLGFFLVLAADRWFS